jgi:hypothetical protein
MRSLKDPDWATILGPANFQKLMHDLCRETRPIEMAFVLQSMEDSGASVPADFLDRAGGAAWPVSPFLDPEKLEPTLPSVDDIAALRASRKAESSLAIAAGSGVAGRGGELGKRALVGAADVDAKGGKVEDQVEAPDAPALLGWLQARRQHLSAIMAGQKLEKRASRCFCALSLSALDTAIQRFGIRRLFAMLKT